MAPQCTWMKGLSPADAVVVNKLGYDAFSGAGLAGQQDERGCGRNGFGLVQHLAHHGTIGSGDAGGILVPETVLEMVDDGLKSNLLRKRFENESDFLFHNGVAEVIVGAVLLHFNRLANVFMRRHDDHGRAGAAVFHG